MIAVASIALAIRDAGEFQLRDSDGAKPPPQAAGKAKIKPTKTEAAMRFIVTEPHTPIDEKTRVPKRSASWPFTNWPTA